MQAFIYIVHVEANADWLKFLGEELDLIDIELKVLFIAYVRSGMGGENNSALSKWTLLNIPHFSIYDIGRRDLKAWFCALTPEIIIVQLTKA